jgi:hypothetical protein
MSLFLKFSFVDHQAKIDVEHLFVVDQYVFRPFYLALLCLASKQCSKRVTATANKLFQIFLKSHFLIFFFSPKITTAATACFFRSFSIK